MRIDTLVLEDFRNYERQELEFGAGLNHVVGSNAQGKTNLLEAIYCLSGLGSPRGPDGALVREGAERALLHAEIRRGDRRLRIDLELRPGRGRRALLNRTPLPGPRALGEVVVGVFFGPDDLGLVKAGPDGRRRFLDELAVKLRPARQPLRTELERVLKQRNALLRSLPRDASGARAASGTLEVWDDALARVGAEVTRARLEVLAALASHVQKRYESVAGGGSLELVYSSEWLGDVPASGAEVPERSMLGEKLAEAIAHMRPREQERAVSLVGPHRDDLSLQLSSPADPGPARDARSFASQGDQRTCALALKLGEFDLIAETLGDEPLLLLDDVFSELDPGRRSWLAQTIAGVEQSFISSTDAAAIAPLEADRLIEVVRGRAQVREASGE